MRKGQSLFIDSVYVNLPCTIMTISSARESNIGLKDGVLGVRQEYVPLSATAALSILSVLLVL